MELSTQGGILVCIMFYFLGRMSLGLYFKKQFTKAVKQKDLKRLRDLEYELRRNSFLYILYPVCVTFLYKLEDEIDTIHTKTADLIGIDYFMIIREAEDSYKNLNGLTTSEDDEGEYT